MIKLFVEDWGTEREISRIGDYNSAYILEEKNLQKEGSIVVKYGF